MKTKGKKERTGELELAAECKRLGSEGNRGKNKRESRGKARGR